MSNPSSCKISGSEASGASSSMRMLPKTFSPSINEVMIGRGRKVANHAGNDGFQELIHSQLYEYSRAKTKASKSAIIVRVLNQVRENSHVGGFIKQDSKTKRWFALEDAAARISTAQAFRDALSGTYRSSKQYKQQKRWRQKSNSPITTPSDTLDDDDDEEEEEPQQEVHATVVAPVVSPVFAPPVVKNSSVNRKFAAWKAQDTKDLFPSVSASVSMFRVSPCASPFPFSHQQQPSQQRKASMTMSGLKGILDSALDIMDDDSDFLFGNDYEATFQLPEFTPAVAADEKEDINVLLDSFEQNVEFTENPFEPKPISAPSSSTSVSPLQFPQELFFKHQQQQSPQKWQPLPQQPCMPSALPFAQYKPGASNSSREQSFSLRDFLSFQPV